MKNILCVLVMCFLTNTILIASSPPPAVTLEEGKWEYSIGKHLEILKDHSSLNEFQVSFQEVSADSADSLFVKNKHLDVSFEDGIEHHWLRFKIKNNTDNPDLRWLLDSDNFAATIEMFLVYPDKTVKHKKANTINQDIDDMDVVLDLELQPRDEVEVYLLVRGAHHYFSIREEAAFYKYARVRDMLYTALLSIFSIMIVYNLIIFVIVRDESYLYYSLYCIGFILYQITMVGFGLQYLWPNYPWINSLGMSMLGFTILFGTMAARSFLKTKEFSVKFDRLMILIVYLSAILIVCDLLSLHMNYFIFGIGLSAVTAVVLFVAGILAWKKGYHPARYYVIGWTLLLISILIYFFSVIGLLPINFFTRDIVKIASVVEIVFLSLGLADRINVVRRDKTLAQEKVIKTLKDNEKIKDTSNLKLRQKADELEAAYSDLVESKGEAAKLQELDEAKTRFFANISHEFRTPLTLILGQVERFMTKAPLLSNEKFVPHGELEEYQLIQRNAERLLDLINQLLELSKLEAGELQLKAEKADGAAFLKIFVASFYSLAESRGIALEFRQEDNFADLYIDKDKLEKTVGNLISNAFKFTESGGRVCITLKKTTVSNEETISSEYFTIEVKDTGIGIEPEMGDKIFDRFYQADTSYTKVQDGTGIGLALVKELVKVQYGKITVQSEQNKGTCFTVMFPVGKDHLKKEEIVTPQQLSGTSGFSINKSKISENKPVQIDVQDNSNSSEKPLLLIVEDNADVRSFIVNIFLDEFIVLEALDGQEGFEFAIEKVPDIIISDLMMPKLDGFDLCKHLKLDEKTSHIPFILLTARADVESRIEGLETGADDYLIKPFKSEELRARVQNLVEGRKRLQEHYSKRTLLKPKEVAIDSREERFLNRLMLILEEKSGDPDFTIEILASDLGMSRTQLHRKLKALNGESASNMLRNFRLQRAAQLIEAKYGNTSEIAYQVGFNNLSYFSKCFREVYGENPSEFKGRDHKVKV